MKPINEQISPQFVNQAKKLAKYTRLLRNILPVECHSHVQVANIRNQNLMLITDSPVWTTRLRQLSPQILQYIRDSSLNANKASDDFSGDNLSADVIHHVQISTRYQVSGDSPTSPQIKNRPKPKISEKTAELLSQSANSIENQQLKTALLKLAKVNKQSKGEK